MNSFKNINVKQALLVSVITAVTFMLTVLIISAATSDGTSYQGTHTTSNPEQSFVSQVRNDLPQLALLNASTLQTTAVQACMDAEQYGPLSLGQITRAFNSLQGTVSELGDDMHTFLNDAEQAYCPAYVH